MKHRKVISFMHATSVISFGIVPFLAFILSQRKGINDVRCNALLALSWIIVCVALQAVGVVLIYISGSIYYMFMSEGPLLRVSLIANFYEYTVAVLAVVFSIFAAWRAYRCKGAFFPPPTNLICRLLGLITDQLFKKTG